MSTLCVIQHLQEAQMLWLSWCIQQRRLTWSSSIVHPTKTLRLSLTITADIVNPYVHHPSLHTQHLQATNKVMEAMVHSGSLHPLDLLISPHKVTMAAPWIHQDRHPYNVALLLFRDFAYRQQSCLLDQYLKLRPLTIQLHRRRHRGMPQEICPT
jgi:hypothetical protein